MFADKIGRKRMQRMKTLGKMIRMKRKTVGRELNE
jgi:hypothetical protein